MDARPRLPLRLVTVPLAMTALVAALAFTTAAGAVSDNASSTGAAHANSDASDHQSSGTAGTSGVVTEPQPLSNADDNGVGANVPGPYDSTRDGSPSMNGSDNGVAVGKPCAGCVGQADNKNPPGQLPGGSDLNAGFECDRNQGIGQTNPAHTGCVSSTVTPPEGVTPTPGAVVPAASVADASGSAAAPAVGGLPRTGSNVTSIALAGVLSLVLGAAALAAARARSAGWKRV